MQLDIRITCEREPDFWQAAKWSHSEWSDGGRLYE